MSYFQKGVVNPLDSVFQNHSWKDQPPLDAPLPVALRYFYISQSAAQIKVDNNKEELLWFVDVYYSAPELARPLFITTDCSSLNLYPSARLNVSLVWSIVRVPTAGDTLDLSGSNVS